ncbi:MAG: hypothetical protein HYT80_10555, partial [Euryarchaeota archaeon]|nr:hypothetical protein [Euryarchaeota archaeon]
GDTVYYTVNDYYDWPYARCTLVTQQHCTYDAGEGRHYWSVQASDGFLTTDGPSWEYTVCDGRRAGVNDDYGPIVAGERALENMSRDENDIGPREGWDPTESVDPETWLEPSVDPGRDPDCEVEAEESTAGGEYEAYRIGKPIPADAEEGVDFANVRYTVYVGTTPSPSEQACAYVAAASCFVGMVQPGLTYYWQVSVSEGHGASYASSPVWSFTASECSAQGWCPGGEERRQLAIPDDSIPIVFGDTETSPGNVEAVELEAGFEHGESPSATPGRELLEGDSTRQTCDAQNTQSGACTVILVHGFAGVTNPSQSGVGQWSSIGTFFAARGYDWRRMAWYGGECQASADVGHHESHNMWMANHHIDKTGCGGVEHSLRHDRDTDIRHVAFHFAWWLYNHHSQRNETVEIVAHSLGGLMVRYAVAMVERQAAGLLEPNERWWPEKLLVENVVTLATMHDGVISACYSTWAQAQNMCFDKKTMKWLRANAQNPQASDGTIWGVMGSEVDEWVSERSAVALATTLKVKYLCDGDDMCKPPAYQHDEYYRDGNLAADAYMAYLGADASGKLVWFRTKSGPRPVLLAFNLANQENYGGA